ncbi:MAG: TfoX/Sxy family protein [Alphaproteobacteria bacterium]|nr:TfoX/Sxy family protein [Alphaproteobacteria bacterium]
MTDPVSTIRNLGPATEKMFARAGITSAEQLRDLGADEAYIRVLASGTAPHFIGYYALVMGLQGRPWNDCQGQEKTDLRVKFDRLKAQVTQTEKGHLGIEAALDKIGVVKRSR